MWFAYPGEIDIELVDRASRTASLAAGDTAMFDLEVALGPEAPEIAPLEVVVESAGAELAEWPLPLALSGDTTVLEAPRILATERALESEVGAFSLPLTLEDDRGISHAVAYLDGEKVGWVDGGGAPTVSLMATGELQTGVNRFKVYAWDTQGLRAFEQFVVLGRGKPLILLLVR